MIIGNHKNHLSKWSVNKRYMATMFFTYLVGVITGMHNQKIFKKGGFRYEI